MSSVERRLKRLEKERARHSPCPECGGADGGNDDTYEVVWTDDAEEEWCETCGGQTAFVIRWPEDLP